MSIPFSAVSCAEGVPAKAFYKIISMTFNPESEIYNYRKIKKLKAGLIKYVNKHFNANQI
jgi:hypothetical protein